MPLTSHLGTARDIDPLVRPFDAPDLIFEAADPPVLDRRVSMIQALLKWKGVYHGPVNARFDAVTAHAVSDFQGRNGLTKTGKVDRDTGKLLGLPYWDQAVELQLAPPFRDPGKFPVGFVFKFRALAEGGFFSAAPHKGHSNGNPLTLRAVRTNNPGALNISRWQKEMTGYAGKTGGDASQDHNQTTIYTSPEYGVAAWAYLLRVKYFNGDHAPVTLKRIIDKYRGGNNADDYIRGYNKYSNGTLTRDTLIDLYDNTQLAGLAIAAYSHELGAWYPLSEAQMAMGLQLADQQTVTWQRLPALRRLQRFPGNVRDYFDRGVDRLGHNEERLSDD